MSLIGVAAGALHALADAAERLEGTPHGSWCEDSMVWMPSTPDARIIPVRIADEVIVKMLSENGWERDVQAVVMRNAGDDTFHMFFAEAEEIDLLSNRTAQQMVLTALDLVQALDASNCELSEDSVLKLAEFKRVSRQRLSPS